MDVLSSHPSENINDGLFVCFLWFFIFFSAPYVSSVSPEFLFICYMFWSLSCMLETFLQSLVILRFCLYLKVKHQGQIKNFCVPRWNISAGGLQFRKPDVESDEGTQPFLLEVSQTSVAVGL